MKITGAEWKRFEAEGWPKGWIWTDESILDDGRNLYPEHGAEAEIIIADGETFIVPADWGCELEERAQGIPAEVHSIRSLIRRWRKSRDTVTLVLAVPKRDEDAARVVLGARGWTVT